MSELLVVPYIDQDTRKGLESYLSNKWSITISNEVSVAPNFEGPTSPIGRSSVANYYPPVLEDRPSSTAIFVEDKGEVAGGPSGGIWLDTNNTCIIGIEYQALIIGTHNRVKETEFYGFIWQVRTSVFFRTYWRSDYGS